MTDTVDSSADKLVEDFNAVIADTERLLRSFRTAGGEKADALRADLEANLAAARERLNELQVQVRESTGAAVRKADEYVHDNPWQAVGIAAGVAAIAGLVAGLMIGRR